jgi:hypothetical protein
MLMPRFVEFEREGARSAETPMFTLQARGLLSLNHAAYRALGQPEHVTLLYDEDEQIVGIRLVAEDHPNAHRVRPQGGSYIIGAQKFTSHYGIKPLVAQRFVAHDYGNSVWGFVLTEGRPVINRRGATELAPAYTGRWRTTSDGFEVPALMRLRDAAPPQPVFAALSPGNEPASIRIGALIACEPLGSTPSTPELGQCFLRFMASPGVMDLVASLTCLRQGGTWERWAGNGRMMLEAGLTDPSPSREELRGSAVAWARLLLPEVAMSSYGRDPRFAQLILHVEPRGDGSGPANPADIRAWHSRFTKALQIPEALRDFLEKTLGLITSDDPSAQLGIELKTRQSIADLVDFKGLKRLEGSQPRPWYMGWTIADAEGQPPAQAAVELLRSMCDYTLQVDDYEDLLASLAKS